MTSAISSRLNDLTEEIVRVGSLRDVLHGIRFMSRCREELLITFVFETPPTNNSFGTRCGGGTSSEDTSPTTSNTNSPVRAKPPLRLASTTFDVFALGSPPATPAHLGPFQQDSGSTDIPGHSSITFLLATYEKYGQPHVWLRTFHPSIKIRPIKKNEQYGPKAKGEVAAEDRPLYMRTIERWCQNSGTSATPRLYNILSELFYMCTSQPFMPCSVNWEHELLKPYAHLVDRSPPVLSLDMSSSQIQSSQPELLVSDCRKGIVSVLGLVGTLMAVLGGEPPQTREAICPDVRTLVTLYGLLLSGADVGL
eukprot:PhF_6_TR25721/c0_g1_i1/m.36249